MVKTVCYICGEVPTWSRTCAMCGKLICYTNSKSTSSRSYCYEKVSGLADGADDLCWAKLQAAERQQAAHEEQRKREQAAAEERQRVQQKEQADAYAMDNWQTDPARAAGVWFRRTSAGQNTPYDLEVLTMRCCQATTRWKPIANVDLAHVFHGTLSVRLIVSSLDFPITYAAAFHNAVLCSPDAQQRMKECHFERVTVERIVNANHSTTDASSAKTAILHRLYMETMVFGADDPIQYVLESRQLTREAKVWCLKQLSATPTGEATALMVWCGAIATVYPGQAASESDVRTIIPAKFTRKVSMAFDYASRFDRLSCEEATAIVDRRIDGFEELEEVAKLVGPSIHSVAVAADPHALWQRFAEHVREVKDLANFFDHLETSLGGATWVASCREKWVASHTFTMTAKAATVAELKDDSHFLKSQAYLHLRATDETAWSRAALTVRKRHIIGTISKKQGTYWQPASLPALVSLINAETERTFEPSSLIKDVVDFFEDSDRVSAEVAAKRAWLVNFGELHQLVGESQRRGDDAEAAKELRKYLAMTDAMTNEQFKNLERFLADHRFTVSAPVIAIAKLWLSDACIELRRLCKRFEGQFIFPQLINQTADRQLVSAALHIIRTMPGDDVRGTVSITGVLAAATALHQSTQNDGKAAHAGGNHADIPGIAAIHSVRTKCSEVESIVTRATEGSEDASTFSDLRTAVVNVSLTRDAVSLTERPTDITLTRSEKFGRTQSYDVLRLDDIYYNMSVNGTTLTPDMRFFQDTFPLLRRFIALAHSCLREGFFRFAQLGGTHEASIPAFHKLGLTPRSVGGFTGFALRCTMSDAQKYASEATTKLVDLLEAFHQAREEFRASCTAAAFFSKQELGLLAAGAAGRELVALRTGSEPPTWRELVTDRTTTMSAVFDHLGRLLEPCVVQAPPTDAGLVTYVYPAPGSPAAAGCHGAWAPALLAVYLELRRRPPAAYEVALPGGDDISQSIDCVVRRACTTVTPADDKLLFAAVVTAEEYEAAGAAVNEAIAAEAGLCHDLVLLVDARVKPSSRALESKMAGAFHGYPDPRAATTAEELEAFVRKHVCEVNHANSLSDKELTSAVANNSSLPLAWAVVGFARTGKTRTVDSVLGRAPGARALPGKSRRLPELALPADTSARELVKDLKGAIDKAHSSGRRAIVVQVGCTADDVTMGLLFSLLVFRGVATDAGDVVRLPPRLSLCLEVPSTVEGVGIYPLLSRLTVAPRGEEGCPARFRTTEAATQKAFLQWHQERLAAGTLRPAPPGCEHLVTRTASVIARCSRGVVDENDSASEAFTSAALGERTDAAKRERGDLPDALLTWDCDGEPLSLIRGVDARFTTPRGGELPLPEGQRRSFNDASIDNGFTWRTLVEALGRKVTDDYRLAPPGVVATPTVVMAAARLDLCFRSGCCPAVLVGGTGVGKTFLIEHIFCRIKRVPCHSLTVDAAVTARDLFAFVSARLKALPRDRPNDDCAEAKSEVWFFDEVNTTPAQDVIKRLLLDRYIVNPDDNTDLEVPGHVFICAACNPYIKPDTAHGRPAYSVQPVVHPSLRAFCWRIGEPEPAEEELVVRTIARSPVRNRHDHEDPQPLSDPAVLYMTAVIPRLHAFIRDPRAKCPGIPTSLRNVDRAIRLTTRLVDACKIQGKEDLGPQDLPVLAIAIAYFVSLPTESRAAWSRENEPDILNEVNAKLRELQQSSKPPEAGSTDNADTADAATARYDALQAFGAFEPVATILDRACTRVLRCFMDCAPFAATLQKTLGGAVVEERVKENLGLVFMCALARVPLLLIGAPGTSKSLAVYMFVNGALQSEIKNANPVLAKGSVLPFFCQGSAFMTSRGIHAFLSEAASVEGGGGIVLRVFDELGHVQDAPGHPLKTLNAALDKPTAFVATSNIGVDRSIINRCVVVQCHSTGLEGDGGDVRRLVGDHPLAGHLARKCGVLQELDNALLNGQPTHAQKLFGLRDLFAFARDEQFRNAVNATDGDFVEAAVRCLSERYDAVVPQQGLLDQRGFETLEYYMLRERLEEIATGSNNNRRKRPLFVDTDTLSTALEALRIAGIAAPQLICGATLRADRGMFHLLMLEIKDAMQLGKFIVLMRCAMLYDSLFDVFNGHYQESMEGGLRVRVTFEGRSQLWRVHPNFSLMVLSIATDAASAASTGHAATVSDVSSATTAAFLSRFEKRVLRLEGMLEYEPLGDADTLLEHARGAVVGYHPFLASTLLSGRGDADAAGYDPEALADLLRQPELRRLRIPETAWDAKLAGAGAQADDLLREMRAVVDSQSLMGILRGLFAGTGGIGGSGGGRVTCVINRAPEELCSVRAAVAVHVSLVARLKTQIGVGVTDNPLPARFVRSDASDVMLEFVILNLCRSKYESRAALYVCGDGLSTASLYGLCRAVATTAALHRSNVLLVVRPPTTKPAALCAYPGVQYTFVERFTQRTSPVAAARAGRLHMADALPKALQSVAANAVPGPIRPLYKLRLAEFRAALSRTESRAFFGRKDQRMSASECLCYFDAYLDAAADARAKMSLHLTNLAALEQQLVKSDEAAVLFHAAVAWYRADANVVPPPRRPATAAAPDDSEDDTDDEDDAASPWHERKGPGDTLGLPRVMPPRLDGSLIFSPLPLPPSLAASAASSVQRDAAQARNDGAYWEAVQRLIDTKKSHADRGVAGTEADTKRLAVMSAVSQQRAVADAAGCPVRHRGELLALYTIAQQAAGRVVRIDPTVLNLLRAVGPAAVTAEAAVGCYHQQWIVAPAGETLGRFETTEERWRRRFLGCGADRRPRVRASGAGGDFHGQPVVDLMFQRLRVGWPDVARDIDLRTAERDAQTAETLAAAATSDRGLRHFLFRWNPGTFTPERYPKWVDGADEDLRNVHTLAKLLTETSGGRQHSSTGTGLSRAGSSVHETPRRQTTSLLVDEDDVDDEDDDDSAMELDRDGSDGTGLDSDGTDNRDEIRAIRESLSALEAAARRCAADGDVPRLAMAARLVVDLCCGTDGQPVLTRDMAMDLQVRDLPPAAADYVLATFAQNPDANGDDGAPAGEAGGDAPAPTLDSGLLDVFDRIVRCANAAVTVLRDCCARALTLTAERRDRMGTKLPMTPLTDVKWLAMTADDQVLSTELLAEVLYYGDGVPDDGGIHGDYGGVLGHLHEVLHSLARPTLPDASCTSKALYILTEPATPSKLAGLAAARDA